ncbi:MAG: DUF4256 domain-containing protein [Erysipelotrichaceae bacterium]|jgi:hypothetical protein
MSTRTLTPSDLTDLLNTLEIRFKKNMHRHQELVWDDVKERLLKNPEKCWSLNEMERTEGEPDVIGWDENTKELVFVDCSAESPKGRRSICYDKAALDARKENKPADSAMNMAINMGIELLDEAQYRDLQDIGVFDIKTSSWIKTPVEIRSLGGALFCDRRYNTVFTYHNGADSYYGVRGFRGILKV